MDDEPPSDELINPSDPAPALTTAMVAADYALASVAVQWRALSEQQRAEWFAHHELAGELSDPEKFIARLLDVYWRS